MLSPLQVAIASLVTGETAVIKGMLRSESINATLYRVIDLEVNHSPLHVYSFVVLINGKEMVNLTMKYFIDPISKTAL